MVKIMATVSIGCVTRRVPQPSDVRKVGEGGLLRTSWRRGASFLSGGSLAGGGGVPLPILRTLTSQEQFVASTQLLLFVLCPVLVFSLNKHLFLVS